MTLVQNKVQVFISGTVGSMDPYQIELKDLFTHNSTKYCPLRQFRIYKLLNHSSNLTMNVDNNRMELDASSGQWTLKDVSTDFMNISVFIQAFNGKIWSNTISQQLLQIDI